MSLRIAKLGEAGKWHIVVMTREGEVFTACGNVLKPFKSSIRTVEIEHGIGEPTRKHCINKHNG